MLHFFLKFIHNLLLLPQLSFVIPHNSLLFKLPTASVNIRVISVNNKLIYQIFFQPKEYTF